MLHTKPEAKDKNGKGNEIFEVVDYDTKLISDKELAETKRKSRMHALLH